MDQRGPRGYRPALTIAAKVQTQGSSIQDLRLEELMETTETQDPKFLPRSSRSEVAETLNKKSRSEKKEQYRQEPSLRSSCSKNVAETSEKKSRREEKK